MPSSFILQTKKAMKAAPSGTRLHGLFLNLYFTFLCKPFGGATLNFFVQSDTDSITQCHFLTSYHITNPAFKRIGDNCQHIVDKKSCHDIVDNRLFLTTS